MVWKEVELKRDFWTPICENQAVEGVVIAIDKEGQYGTEHTIQVSPESIVKLPAHKILQKLLEDIDVGRKVRVTFKGEKPTTKGNPVQIYKLEVWEDEPQAR